MTIEEFEATHFIEDMGVVYNGEVCLVVDIDMTEKLFLISTNKGMRTVRCESVELV